MVIFFGLWPHLDGINREDYGMFRNPSLHLISPLHPTAHWPAVLEITLTIAPAAMLTPHPAPTGNAS